VTLLYPPNQTWPGNMCKPNGSLAYPSLAGALLEMGVFVEIFDAAVGNDEDRLEITFYKPTELASGLIRTGVSDDRILEEVADSDVVGLTSIFTDQETMVLRTAELIKKAYPDKLLLAGGVNARSRLEHMFSAGVDIVCLSEAEKTIQRIVEVVRRGSTDFSSVGAIAWKTDDRILMNKTRSDDVVWNLDDLPLPAWHLLPNDRYWTIGRPHGGHFEPGEVLRYGSMITSLGCVFTCSYCHIAGETEDSLAGPVGRFRVKSDGRVLAELEELKRIGVKQVFLEDDTLFGRKQRGIRLLKQIKGAGVDILDVNGINLIHFFKDHQPDRELLETMLEAGFREVVLPFESGSQRIITKYAANKWNVAKHDVLALIRLCKAYGLKIAGNYTIGYPDETREEVCETIEMARKHRQEGLDSANFFLMMPLPGTPLFDMAVQAGHLPRDFNPDKMNWTKANMINTPVSPDELEAIRQGAWKELNDPQYVSYKTNMSVFPDTEAKALPH